MPGSLEAESVGNHFMILLVVAPPLAALIAAGAHRMAVRHNTL